MSARTTIEFAGSGELRPAVSGVPARGAAPKALPGRLPRRKAGQAAKPMAAEAAPVRAVLEIGVINGDLMFVPQPLMLGHYASLRLTGTERVIGYLLRQDAHTAADSEPYVVTLPTSKSVVASRLNVTPEHFSRILHDLADGGLISVDGRDVTIFDAAKLRHYHG